VPVIEHPAMLERAQCPTVRLDLPRLAREDLHRLLAAIWPERVLKADLKSCIIHKQAKDHL
jgi:hypothetical protein